MPRQTSLRRSVGCGGTIITFTLLLQALAARKMWDDTIIVFLGDNGAPNNNAGANTVFKGMKFSHWEGGHRVPAFIGGPGVPAAAALSGKWYNGTCSEELTYHPNP